MLSFKQFVREMDYGPNARQSSNVEDRVGKEHGDRIASIRLMTPKGRKEARYGGDDPTGKSDFPSPAPQVPSNIPKPPPVTGKIPSQKPVSGPME